MIWIWRRMRKSSEVSANRDYELWDTRNDHLLLVYDMGGGRAVKLSVGMFAAGAEVVSGFYQDMREIDAAIKGQLFIRL